MEVPKTDEEVRAKITGFSSDPLIVSILTEMYVIKRETNPNSSALECYELLLTDVAKILK